MSAAPCRTAPSEALSARFRRTLAYAGLWLSLIATAAAAPPAQLGPGDRALDLLPHLSVLEDPGKSLQLEDLLTSDGARRFAPLGDRTASFGYSTSAWWLRASVTNGADQPRDMMLRQSYVLLDYFDLYVVHEGRVLKRWTTGDTLPYSTRPVPHRDYLFPLTIEPRQTLEIYLRARSDGPVNATLTLYSPEALVPALGTEQLAMGALFGSFVLLALCTALLYGFVRDEAFAYYLCYVLCYGGYMAVFNGIAQQHLWPETPSLWGVGQVVLLMLALHFLLHFSRSLLRAKGQSRWLDRAFLALQTVILALMVAAPFVSYGTLVRPITFTVATTVFMVVAIGIAGLRARQAAAGYFLLAWSVFLVGVLLYLAKSLGLLPHTWLTQYGFQIGTIFEFVLLSVALGIRVKEIRQQSRTDSLTGLANRSRYDELVEQAFAQARAAGSTLGLLVIDVDHFKRVNDTHGHAIGDRVLEGVAESLRRQLPPQVVACRYGGEEFVVLVPRTDTAALMALAERLRRAIADSSPGIPVTASIGVASTTDHAFADPRGLFRAADEALYAAKRTGRDRVVGWNNELPRHPAASLVATP
ncbi:MAG TPA: diguanylate cyclase [Arenimonas sp.]